MHRRLGAISPLQAVREPAIASELAIAIFVPLAHSACSMGEPARVATFATPLAERLRRPRGPGRHRRGPRRALWRVGALALDAVLRAPRPGLLEPVALLTAIPPETRARMHEVPAPRVRAPEARAAGRHRLGRRGRRSLRFTRRKTTHEELVGGHVLGLGLASNSDTHIQQIIIRFWVPFQ